VASETAAQEKAAQTAVSTAAQNVSEHDTSPRTGVEVVPSEEREGTRYYRMRDLRNGNIVKNVTQASARRLWHYAITQYLEIADKVDKINIQWQGDFGLIHSYKQDKKTRFDLVQKTPAGYRYFFGVTQDGIHGPWKQLVGEDDL
jgi:hypothetical protein